MLNRKRICWTNYETCDIKYIRANKEITTRHSKWKFIKYLKNLEQYQKIHP